MKDHRTPALVMDLDIIKARYLALRDSLPQAGIYYALKANPLPEVIKALADLGSSFDIASIYELDAVLKLGVDPGRVSYGNTIKKPGDIAYAYERGVRLYACDSPPDVENLAKHAPGSKVFFRIATQGTGSDWPLSRKFGAHPAVIKSIARTASETGLVPYGISFHVGSQQRDIGEFDDAIARAKFLFEDLEEIGIHLQMVNIGGGFPASYLDPTQPIEVYASEIQRFLGSHFGPELPRIIVEPGRYLVGDAGVVVSEVILVTKKARSNIYDWVYVDAGMFGGLIETLGEAIKYPIYFEGTGREREIIIAGPTCDSTDILYENYKYTMPARTATGDRMYVFTAGAYTLSYSSVSFNGFPPLAAIVIP